MVRILTATLRHRHNLAAYAVDDAYVAAKTQLATLCADAMSPVRTSIFGQLMEPAYRGCNMEFGEFFLFLRPSTLLHLDLDLTTNRSRQ
jgi:hypothetical protein